MKLLATAWYHSDWLAALCYFVGTLIVAKVVDTLIARHGSGLGRLFRRDLTMAEQTRLRMARRLIVFAILFIGIASALLQFPQVGTLARGMLASAGITALVAGFAARSMLANLVSGIVIAFTQPVRIGDFVSVDGIEGTVEEIGLTFSYIRAADNHRVVIPNEQFASKVIHNFTIVDAVSAASVEFVLPPGADIGLAERAVLDEAEKLALSDTHPGGGSALADTPPGRTPSFAVVDQAIDSVRVSVTLWAASAPQTQALAADLRRAALDRLRHEGLLGDAPPQP
jgi:small-conductance mechanosensitive channel